MNFIIHIKKDEMKKIKIILLSFIAILMLTSCVALKNRKKSQEFINIQKNVKNKVYLIDRYPRNICFKLLDNDSITVYTRDEENIKIYTKTFKVYYVDIMIDALDKENDINYTFFYNKDRDWFLDIDGDVFRYKKKVIFGDLIITGK